MDCACSNRCDGTMDRAGRFFRARVVVLCCIAFPVVIAAACGNDQVAGDTWDADGADTHDSGVTDALSPDVSDVGDAWCDISIDVEVAGDAHPDPGADGDTGDSSEVLYGDIDSGDIPFTCPEERTCRIDDTCYAEGAPDPADPCRFCRTVEGVSGWEAAMDGTSCGAGRVCEENVCAGPVITEFMAQNDDTIDDEDGESSDWIELYNPTAYTLSLGGYHLSDNRGKPTKWTFPAVDIAPGRYIVVFASGKDRRDPEGILHTNFKLSGDGEDLLLVTPEGDVLQSFLNFPAGIEDVSYGPAVSIVRHQLVVVGDSVRANVPVSGPPPDGWAAIDFPAETPGWAQAVTGVGFDLTLVEDPPLSGDDLGTPAADSIIDWRSAPGQDVGGWTYGYYDRTADPDHTYSGGEFTKFPHDGLGYSATDFWTGSHYDWFDGNPPWTWIGSQSIHPSGENNGVEHWVIRRYTAEQTAPLFVEWHFAKTDTAGNGVSGYVYYGDELVDTAAIEAADTVGVTRVFVLPDVVAGDVVDFALGPVGPDGVSNDTSDMSGLYGVLWTLPDMRDEVATDAGERMFGMASGIYVRNPFELDDGAINRLDLNIKYDDGFQAFINGVPIASDNVPAAPAWDSVALVKRTLAVAKSVQTFDVRDATDILEPGTNVLAIHALNSAVDDPTFLVAPALEGRLVTYDTASERHYSRPTPGADNDDGPLVPVLEHLTPIGGVGVGQDIPVTARLWFMDGPIADATLTYRVMFGPEVRIPLTDDGTGLYTATIPGGVAAPGEMVRWYLTVTDYDGATARAPAFTDPLDSEQYYGTVVAPDDVVSNLQVFHLFIEDPVAADTRTGTRGALFYGSEFYDNVRIDLHGQSTAGFPKKSYDIDFNRDHRFLLSPQFRRMKDINLLSNWADKSKLRNTLAYEVWRESGAAYHLAFPVRVQMNGAFFSVADFVEDGDDRYLERIGLDPEGALYKMYDGLYNVAYGEKKTRKEEDKSDLQALISGLDFTGDDLRNFLYDNVNIPAMANFLAAMIITATTDCCHKNYYAYRDTNGTGEWWYLPWDVDLTFGRNWISTLTYFDDTMHPQNPLYIGSSKLTKALFALPEFKEMYLRRLRTLMDRIQQPPDTPVDELLLERRIDELVALIGADGAADYDAWPKWGEDQTMEQAAAIMKLEFMAPRRTFLFETMVNAGPIPEAQSNPMVVFGDYYSSIARPAESFITLFNPNVFAVDISGWEIAGDISMTFRPGTVLPAGGILYLAANVNAFRARAISPKGGQGLLVQGNWSESATPVGIISLFDDVGNQVSTVW